MTRAEALRRRRETELRRLQRARYAVRIYPLGERVQFELVEQPIRTVDLDEEAVRRIWTASPGSIRSH